MTTSIRSVPPPEERENTTYTRAPIGGRGVKRPGQAIPVDSSPYDVGIGLNLIRNNYAKLAYSLPWEVLDVVEALSTYNADYSQAVDNIRTLANSGHEVFVDAGAKRNTAALKEYLENLSSTIQEPHGGIDGLIDKLLDQAATYGAMCGEWILDEELTTIVDFQDINPKSIRFFWSEAQHKFMPYQKIQRYLWDRARSAGTQVVNGCVALNPVTFHYYAFDSAPSSPYGTPPFVAALEHIGIQKDMIANMSQIVKKIGLLGLVDLVVQQLPPKPGESDEDYASRATAYLDSYVSAAEDMVRDGGMVHFDDVEIKSTNIAGNAAGATNIYKQNEEMIFSGLKSMPSVQGRSYSTTETYAGVAYDIIIRNTKRYQRACKRMIESGYYLAANLAGYQPKTITLKFNDNKTLHRLQDAQSYTLEIGNQVTLWVAGITDQLGMAQSLGFNDIKTEFEEPPPGLVGGWRPTSTDAEPTGTSSDGGGKPDNSNNGGNSGKEADPADPSTWEIRPRFNMIANPMSQDWNEDDEQDKSEE